MRLAFGEFLSRILVKARKKYRFTGIVIGRIGIGIIWPTAKSQDDNLNPNQPKLPGID